jgi:hypothetical protein
MASVPVSGHRFESCRRRFCFAYLLLYPFVTAYFHAGLVKHVLRLLRRPVD